MVSATHTNLTPAKLEEFEATFKHFDKDDTNVSSPMSCGLGGFAHGLDTHGLGDALGASQSRYSLRGRCNRSRSSAKLI